MSSPPSNIPLSVRRGARHAVASAGDLASWARFVTVHPVAGPLEGKVFLKEPLGLSAMEVSLNTTPPGFATAFSHAHKENEELYMFLSGVGEMMLDGETVPVQSGTLVRVEPAAVRAWRNTSTTEPLICVIVQAKAGSLTQWTATDGIRSPAPIWR